MALAAPGLPDKKEDAVSGTARWVDWGATTSKSVITASEAKPRRRRSEDAARADQAESLELREDSGRTKRRSSRSDDELNFEMRGRELRSVERVEGLFLQEND